MPQSDADVKERFTKSYGVGAWAQGVLRVLAKARAAAPPLSDGGATAVIEEVIGGRQSHVLIGTRHDLNGTEASFDRRLWKASADKMVAEGSSCISRVHPLSASFLIES